MENKTYSLSVETPDGVTELKIYHTVENQNDEDMTVIITTAIRDQKVVFQSDTTEDALMQFAKRLPAGWSVKCCLSCRYGHFCPVGDCDNELFCVPDFEPKEPRDLWHVTEDNEERAKRRRTLFDLCEMYVPQSKEYFTYSDYYLSMNDKIL